MIDDTDDDFGAQTVSRKECEHGSLARKCLICELQAELDSVYPAYEAAIGQMQRLDTELSTLRESAKPFAKYAQELMRCNGRDRHKRDDPVTGCNDAVVTTNHCRRLLDAMHPLPKPEDSSDAD